MFRYAMVYMSGWISFGAAKAITKGDATYGTLLLAGVAMLLTNTFIFNRTKESCS